MSNLLDSASIVLTPTAYDNGRMLSVKPIPVYGAELVTNGNFASDSDWNKESGWTISGGNLVATNVSGTACYQTGNGLVAGKTYRVQFEITEYTTGAVGLRAGTGAILQTFSSVGVHSADMVVSGALQVRFDVSGTTTLKIDNVSVKEDISGDFDFSRNSAATRVNAQGLVENVQILSGDLVSNGDFSQEGVQEVSNGSFSQEGAEWFDANNVYYRDNSTNTINLNGTITTELNTSSIGWTINAASILNQNKIYKVEWEILSTNSSSGTFVYWNGVTTQGFGDVSQVGSGVYYIKGDNSGANADIRFDAVEHNSTVNWKISVKEVGQDWTLGAGWSIGEDKAESDGSQSGNSNIYQSTSFVVGKTYKVSYELSDVTAGAAKIVFGDTGGTLRSVNGTYTEYYAFVSGTNFYIQANADFNGSVTNISVKEVGQDWTFVNSNISIDNNGLEIISQGGNRPQANQIISGFTIGNKYKLSAIAKRGTCVSGVEIEISGIGSTVATNKNNTTEFANIFYEFIANSTSHTIQAKIDDGASATGETAFFKSVSLIEITDDTNLPRINYEGFSYQDSLGSEEVVNGDFATNLNGWIVDTSRGTYTWDNSRAKITNNIANSYPNISQTITTIAGKVYKINSTIEIGTASNTEIRAYDNGVLGSQQLNADGNIDFTFTAVGTSTTIHCYLWETGNTGNYCFFDNVSVKEYLGQEVVPDSGCGSWLLEPQSTNLVAYSSDFSQITKFHSTITINNNVSPDGNINGNLWLANATAAEKELEEYYSVTNGATYTESWFVKYKSQQFIQLVTTSATFGAFYGNFDLINGTKESGNFTDFSIEPYLNGWYRISATQVATSSGIGRLAALRMIGSATAPRGGNVTTTGIEAVETWGHQAEQQSYATSYIPTNGAASTRLQDIANNSGNATLINSTEGVLYAEIEALTSTQAATIMISISNGSTNAIKFGYQQGANVFFVESTGTANGIGIYSEPINPLTYSKVALSYKENDVKLYINGVLEAIDTSFTAFAPDILNTLNFDSGTGASKFHGKAKAVVVYKEALTDEQLTCLTTI